MTNTVMHIFSPLLVLLLCFVSSVIGSPVGPSAHIDRRASTETSFQIYAYGENIGGIPLFSTGSSAYLGDYQLVDGNEAAPVIFTATDDGIWLASPNTTGFSSSRTLPSWSNLTLFVPDETSSSHGVGLVDPTSRSTGAIISSGFNLYGTYAYLAGGSSGIQTLWYAVPSDVSGVYSLKWNTTGDDTAGQIILSLATMAPVDSPTS